MPSARSRETRQRSARPASHLVPLRQATPWWFSQVDQCPECIGLCAEGEAGGTALRAASGVVLSARSRRAIFAIKPRCRYAVQQPFPNAVPCQAPAVRREALFQKYRPSRSPTKPAIIKMMPIMSTLTPLHSFVLTANVIIAPATMSNTLAPIVILRPFL